MNNLNDLEKRITPFSYKKISNTKFEILFKDEKHSIVEQINEIQAKHQTEILNNAYREGLLDAKLEMINDV